MKKRSFPPIPERDWLLVGSRSVTTSGIHSPPGPISGLIEPCHGQGSPLRDYADETAWSRRIEMASRSHDLMGDAPDEDQE
jgi:hypothetical protein